MRLRRFLISEPMAAGTLVGAAGPVRTGGPRPSERTGRTARGRGLDPLRPGPKPGVLPITPPPIGCRADPGPPGARSGEGDPGRPERTRPPHRHHRGPGARPVALVAVAPPVDAGARLRGPGGPGRT